MKNGLAAAALSAALLATAVPQSLNAAQISIGGTALYNLWDPSWNNGKLILYPEELTPVKDTHAPRYEIARFWMYGPDLSIRVWRRWELSPSFRYGETATDGGNSSLLFGPVYRVIHISVKRYDVHATFGYYLFDYLKLFAGIRAEITRYAIRYRHYEFNIPPALITVSIENGALQFTPEVGVNFSVPLSPVFTFIFSISGTFQSGSDSLKYKNMFSGIKPELSLTKLPTARYYALGGNGYLALRSTIPAVNISLEIGAYYRILRYIQKASERGMFDLNGSHDHNFGLSCSVLYTFSFGEQKRPRVWIPRPSHN